MNKKIATEVAIGIIIILAVIIGGYFYLEYINNFDTYNQSTQSKNGMESKLEQYKQEKNLMQVESFEECITNNGFKSGNLFPGICHYEYKKGQYKVFVQQSVCGNNKCESVNCEERGIDKINCPVSETTENCPIDCNKKVATWKQYKNERYGFMFQYPDYGEFAIENFESNLKISIIPNITLSIYFDKQLLNSDEYPWKFFGKELIQIQKNYTAYNGDLNSKNRSSCQGEGDCGHYHYNILKRKIDDIPAIDYRQNSVGGPDRSIVFEKNGLIFYFYHSIYYPLPFNENEMAKSDNYQEYLDLEKILSAFKFTN